MSNIHPQQSSELDAIVKAGVDKISADDVHLVTQPADIQIEGRAWNMNQRLNMIAYEDQL